MISTHDILIIVILYTLLFVAIRQVKKPEGEFDFPKLSVKNFF